MLAQDPSVLFFVFLTGTGNNEKKIFLIFSSAMDVDQVEGENKDADNNLETTALFVTQYIQSTSTSLRKDVYKLLPFFCQFVGKNFR